MTKTSVPTTKLQSRDLALPDPQTDRLLSVSHNGIEMVGGRPRLIRPIDPADRSRLAQRKKLLDGLLMPATDSMDRMRIGRAVAEMLAGILSARGADPEETVAVFTSRLCDLPSWVIEEVCDEVGRGCAEGIDPHFPPSAAELHALADKRLTRLRGESIRLNRVLVAE
jgi:hypothetical protein